MGNGSRLPVLQVVPEDVADCVLVMGDPARAEDAAGRLHDVRRVGANREYVTFTGTFDDVPISICSHGVGSSGAAVCFEELARAGARTIIRCGTCGGLLDHIDDGDLIIATGAVRDEGFTPRLIPLGYPALSDFRVIGALEDAARQAGVPYHMGVSLTSDLFYPLEALGGHDWPMWQTSRVVAVDMELAALLIVAALHGIRAGGILTVDGNPTQSADDMSDYDPHRDVVADGVTAMLDIALRAVARLDQ